MRRHPHVFGDGKLETSEQVLVQWEQIKAGEKTAARCRRRASLFKELPPRLPALMYAEAVWKQIGKKGLEASRASTGRGSRGSRPELDAGPLGRMLFELAAAAQPGAWTPRAPCGRHSDRLMRHVEERAPAGLQPLPEDGRRAPGGPVRRPPGPRAPVLALHGAQLPRGVRGLLPLACAGRALGQGASARSGPREIRDFVIEAQRRYGRRTLHNHVSGLRALCRFWMRKGRLKANPFSAVPLPKLERRLPQFLTEEQVRALLASPGRLLEAGGCDAFTAWRDRLAMELLYGAGLRVSELVGLNHGSVDLGEGVARVPGQGPQGARLPARQGGVRRPAQVPRTSSPRARAPRTRCSATRAAGA